MNKKLFAIFGNPVSHSKSPLIHNSLFRELEIDACYTRYLLDDGGGLKEKFFELGLSGINITIPFKEDAFLACDVLDDYAKNIGAVNTIVLKEGLLYGFNTDAPGFMASLDGFLPKKAIILGAGGTARAIAFALRKAGVLVCIANRSAGRLEFFEKADFRTVTFDMLDEAEQFDLVVNTTSAGLTDEELPLNEKKLMRLLSNAKLAYDCIYKETSFLKMAKKLDKENKNGLDMLIWQAVFAFEKFVGIDSDKRMLDVIKRAVY
ncbi:MAG: shikimate dehydrogenase [Campylobacteraceae bacterium]|nr:shikimate dehydrogenase [Campylobacteraceae bacterium]